MADILKLKKKAADFEAKKQPDKALATYREMIEVYERGDEDPIDIPLYNRVGDLLQKAGNLPEAVSVWERAVDHYTDGGFYNPAIALCNKILRQSPGRAIVYYKLGKISAEKGFKSDARQNFLEYASRMQQQGNLDEAFRALKEFADLVPDQDDVRVMLADQLVKANRKPEAIDQLQIAYAQLVREQRDADAEAVAKKMKAIDPTVEPKADDEGGGGSKGGGLVFLEVEPSSGPDGRRSRTSRAGMTPADAKRASKAIQGLELLDPGAPVETKRPAAAAPVAPVAPKAAPPAPPAEEKLVSPPPRVSAPAAKAPAAPAPAAPPPRDPTPIKPPAVVPPPADIPMLEIETTSLVEEPPAVDEDLVVLDEPPAEAPRRATVESGLSDFDSFGAPSESSIAADLTTFNPMDAAATEPLPALPLDEAVLEPVIEAEPSFGEVVEEPVIPRESSTVLALSVDSLRDQVGEAPEDWGLRRQLAEALLDDGQKDEGVAELEVALAGFERDGDLDTAASIAEEIVRLAPTVIRYHQKRVEFAFRANDRGSLAEAYVELADALVRDGQGPKARVVYQRVLEIQPDDIRAQAALETLVEAPVPEPAPVARRSTAASRKSVAQPAPKTAAPKKKKADEEEFVSLGDWLREEEEPKSTRMVVEEKEPTGDEQADFADMLRKFKQGVSDNVDDEDFEAHYDLGVAYKEMGLLDEAISEFQKALRGTANRVRALEALGLCFVEKQQLPVAATILQRALTEPGVRDDSLIGVLYLLGTISEELAMFPDAKKHYQRVFAVDIQFRDVGDRLNAIEKKLK